MFCEEDSVSEIPQGIALITHVVLILMKFFRTKPQVKIKKINYYYLYYTVSLSLPDIGEK